MTQTTPLAIIGFGEVGKLFSRQFLERGDCTVAVYDILFADPDKGPALHAAAREIGVRAASSPADAAKDARVVMSAVTASSVQGVAEAAASYLHQGQYFFDVNSASPVTKKNAAAKVNAAHAKYVEGAVMQPVGGIGIKVPILGGGPYAVELATLMNGLGMNITPVTTEPGRASAMKLCRSIVIKAWKRSWWIAPPPRNIGASRTKCSRASTRHGRRSTSASLPNTWASAWRPMACAARRKCARPP